MRKVDSHFEPEFRSNEELLATINANLIVIIELLSPVSLTTHNANTEKESDGR